MTRRVLIGSLGLTAYAMFLLTITYFVGFVENAVVPKTIESGPASSAVGAAAIDLLLIAFFGLLHSVMARRSFKRVWTRVVPVDLERSVYVLVANLQLALLCWQWRPLPGLVLFRASGAAATALLAVSLAGWGLMLASSFMIDHFDLFGLRQAFGRPARPGTLHTPYLYRFVRHPLYLGLLIGLWVTPIISASHLLLASALTLYVLIGIRHEEADLVRTYGDLYRQYQKTVPMLVPLRIGQAARSAPAAHPANASDGSTLPGLE